MRNEQRKISHTPVTDSLNEEGVFVDNEIELATRSTKLFSRLSQFGFEKSMVIRQELSCISP